MEEHDWLLSLIPRFSKYWYYLVSVGHGDNQPKPWVFDNLEMILNNWLSYILYF